MQMKSDGAYVVQNIVATPRECTCCRLVSRFIIRDFLGHEGVMTTQTFARANLDMKRTALDEVDHAATFPDMPS